MENKYTNKEMNQFFKETKPELLQGNAVEVVKTLKDDSIQCVVTSPPYWALRDSGVNQQLKIMLLT